MPIGFCKLKCEVEDGAFPHEKRVKIVTADGTHYEAETAEQYVQGGTVLVRPLREKGHHSLVEVPGGDVIVVEKSQLAPCHGGGKVNVPIQS
ncbi:MAG: hypothetical protein NTW87_08330 [Planctomycetota bacterium]|nr:hypothetical protein [Planctomycetota bacterium]